MAADVLLRDGSGRVLLVNPTYKPGWDLPGGMAEANEPPEEAVRRELVEELGLHVTLRGLLVVDWVAPHGPWDDQLAFIFDGGTLDQDHADRLRPRDEELSEAAFVTAAEAGLRLRGRMRRRFEGGFERTRGGTAAVPPRRHTPGVTNTQHRPQTAPGADRRLRTVLEQHAVRVEVDGRYGRMPA